MPDILSDCDNPSADKGYEVRDYGSTTYGSSLPMKCATGYNGKANDISCTAKGTWTTQTGCSIVSKYCRYPMITWHLTNFFNVHSCKID